MGNKEKKSFVFNCEWQEVLMEYPSEVRLEVYDAIIEYVASGKLSELKPLAKMAFSFIKKEIDYNQKKYDEKLGKDKENGKKGGNPNFKKGKSNPYYQKDNPKITQDNPPLSEITQDNPPLSEITQDNPPLSEITKDNPINDNEYDNDIKENPLSGEKENPINPIFDLELDECERLLRAQEEWKQTLCMNNRSSGFGWFTMEDLDAYITKFFMKLHNEGEDRKTLKDAKSHFARWLAIELQNDMSGYNRELRNSTDDKELKSFISYMERKCPNCFVNMKMPNEEQFGNLRKTMDKKEIAELSEKIENRKTLQGNRNSLYTTILEMKGHG